MERGKQLLKDRWNALKSAQLSKNTINTRIENYRKQLVSTNAFSRERATWTNIAQDLDIEASYMQSWYSTQFDQFDAYVRAL
jgi:hypothetical protein